MSFLNLNWTEITFWLSPGNTLFPQLRSNEQVQGSGLNPPAQGIYHQHQPGAQPRQ